MVVKPRITSTEQAQEMGRKGGLVSSEQKKYASLISASHKAKCYRCKAICVLKKANLEQSKGYKCSVPDARGKAIWYNKPVMTEEILNKLEEETLLKLMAGCKDNKDLKLLHSCMMEKKKVDYPQVKKIQVDQRVITYEDLKDIYDEMGEEE